MSDATEPRQNTPFPAEAPPAIAQLDPLAGDWSLGLRAAVRALGIPEPKLLPIEHIAPPPPTVFVSDVTPASPAPSFEAPAPSLEAPAPSFEADKTPPLPTRMPEAFRPDAAPPAPAHAFEAPPAVELRAEDAAEGALAE